MTEGPAHFTPGDNGIKWPGAISAIFSFSINTYLSLACGCLRPVQKTVFADNF